MDRRQTSLAFIQIEKVLFVGHEREFAFRSKSPTVETAAEAAWALAPLVEDQGVAAVWTDIVEGANFVVVTVNDKNGGVTHDKFLDKILAALGNFLGAPDVDPVAPEYSISFEFEIFGRNTGFSGDWTGASVRIFFGPLFVGELSLHRAAFLSETTQSKTEQ
jgi:hypothetical protein